MNESLGVWKYKHWSEQWAGHGVERGGDRVAEIVWNLVTKVETLKTDFR